MVNVFNYQTLEPLQSRLRPVVQIQAHVFSVEIVSECVLYSIHGTRPRHHSLVGVTDGSNLNWQLPERALQ
jgi:hypothetical protein